MSRVRPLYVRVLVVRQGSEWLAQGLEYDVAAQGPSDESALNAFARIIRAHIRHDYELGREPFEGVPPAPERFIQVWEGLEQGFSWQPVTFAKDSSDGEIPPAYILQAIARNADVDLSR